MKEKRLYPKTKLETNLLFDLVLIRPNISLSLCVVMNRLCALISLTININHDHDSYFIYYNSIRTYIILLLYDSTYIYGIYVCIHILYFLFFSAVKVRQKSKTRHI